MAHVSIDTNLWDQDEAIALGDLLGDEDAWRFLVRLWAWGIDADCESGVMRLPPRRLAQVVGFCGDPNALHAALVKTGWLIPQGDGAFYMRGWDRNRRFFAEKKRLRESYEKRKTTLVKNDEVTRESRVNNAGDTRESRSPPSPSPSPSLYKETYTSSSTSEPDGELGPVESEVVGTSPPKRGDQVPVSQVIEHYRRHHPRAKPGTKELRLVKARLAEGYSVSELCQAIDGCHLSPFHCGRNDQGKKFQSLELIMRNSSKVHDFISLCGEASGSIDSETERINAVLRRIGVTACNGSDNKRLQGYSDEQIEAAANSIDGMRLPGAIIAKLEYIYERQAV